MNSQRDCFSATVTRLLEEDPRATFITADIGTDRVKEAMARFPDRCRNVGIREALAIGIAAGQALEGFRPIVHSYAPFVVERVYEQLKLDLGHQGVGAVVATVGASHDWAAGGFTHHSPADVALLGTLAGWAAYVPGHADEVEPLLRAAMRVDHPVYLRLTEDGNERARSVTPGRLTTERLGRSGELAIIAIGPMLDRVLAAVHDRDADVHYATTALPLDLEPVLARRSRILVVVEPFQEGTTAASLVADGRLQDMRLHCLGIPRGELRRYGTAAEHDAAHGLDVAGLRSRLQARLGEPT